MNITPDKETGIGGSTDKEIARSLQAMVFIPMVSAVFDFMVFHDVVDEDLTAVISYLRSRPAVRNEVPEHRLNASRKDNKGIFMVKPVGPSGPVPQRNVTLHGLMADVPGIQCGGMYGWSYHAI